METGEQTSPAASEVLPNERIEAKPEKGRTLPEDECRAVLPVELPAHVEAEGTETKPPTQEVEIRRRPNKKVDNKNEGNFTPLDVLVAREKIVAPPTFGEAVRGRVGQSEGAVFYYDVTDKFQNENEVVKKAWVVFTPDAVIVDITDIAAENLAIIFPKMPGKDKQEAKEIFKEIVKKGVRIDPEKVKIGKLLGAGWARWNDKDCLVVEVSVGGENRIAIVKSTGVFNAPYRSGPGQELPRRSIWVSKDKSVAEQLAQKITGGFPPYRTELLRLSETFGAISVTPVNQGVEREIRKIVAQGEWLDHATLRGHKLSPEKLVEIVGKIETGEVAGFLVNEGYSRIRRGWRQYSLYMEAFFKEEGRILRTVVVFHFDTPRSIANFKELVGFEILPLTRYILTTRDKEGLPCLVDLFLGSIRSGDKVMILDGKGGFVSWGSDYYTFARFFTRILKTKVSIGLGSAISKARFVFSNIVK